MESSDWIALSAAAFSLFAVAVSIYEAVSNKPRLRVSASFAVVGETEGVFLTVSAVNYGRQPTTISHLEIDITKSKAKAAMQPISVSATLPHLLEVGRTATFVIPCDKKLADRFGLGVGGTIQEILMRPGNKLLLRDVWHRKPRRVLVN